MSTLASPCIGVCRLRADGLCGGCLRSLDEIAAWGGADDARRAEILAAVAQRCMAAGLLAGDSQK